MFDDADPVLDRLRALALAFPDASEKISHGHPAFFTTKIFAYYGGSVKVDGAYQRHERSVLVLVDPDERRVLLAEARCYVPAYLGAYGWIGVDLADDTDWAEINELLDASYRRTAGSRRVAALNGPGGARSLPRRLPGPAADVQYVVVKLDTPGPAQYLVMPP